MAILTATNTDFHQLISNDFVIVDFYSTTCVPCKLFSRILEDIEAEIPFVNIVKVCINDCPQVARQMQISAVPTVHFYRDGTLLETHLGVLNAQQIKEKIADYLYA